MTNKRIAAAFFGLNLGIVGGVAAWYITPLYFAMGLLACVWCCVFIWAGMTLDGSLDEW